MSCGVGNPEIFDGIYFLENVETKRYVFQDGEPMKGNRGDEGGWTNAPLTVGADANYYNRAYWKITHQGNGKYFVENVETQRYLFQAGDPVKCRGDEGAYGDKPRVVGSDANYYNRAYWRFVPQNDNLFFIENVETERYLFQIGDPISGERGAEGGWKASSGFKSPSVKGSDDNYDNRAYYRVTKVK